MRMPNVNSIIPFKSFLLRLIEIEMNFPVLSEVCMYVCNVSSMQWGCMTDRVVYNSSE